MRNVTANSTAKQDKRKKSIGAVTTRSLLNIVRDAICDVPEKELARLPVDGAANHDKYLGRADALKNR